MTAFTPGPWKLAKDDPDTETREVFAENWRGIPNTREMGLIAFVCQWKGQCMPGDIAEAAGNARLIAQAPTMFGLLRECLPYIQKSRFGQPAVDGLLDRIEAAILEVEGK